MAGDMVFISYSRRRDTEIARRIESALEAEFNVWRDERDENGIAPGAEFEGVIMSAIQDSWCVLFLVSSRSIASDWCRSELMYALNLNKAIIPIMVDDGVEPHEIPLRLQRRNYIDFTLDELDAITKLQKALRNQRDGTISTTTTDAVAQTINTPLIGLEQGEPYMVGRDKTIDSLKQRLNIGGRQATDAVFAINGMAGLGKTTVALGLVYDAEVQRMFPDGILWAALGPDVDPTDIRGMIAGWGDALGKPDLTNLSGDNEADRVEFVAKKLTELLSNKRVLLVVDDVWEASHLDMFRLGRANNPMIFTTRDRELAVGNTAMPDHRLDLPHLTFAPSWKLFTDYAPSVSAEFEKPSKALVTALEGLPLTILVGGRTAEGEYVLGATPDEMIALFEDLATGTALVRTDKQSTAISNMESTVRELVARSVNRLDDDCRRAFALLSQIEAKPATFDDREAAALWNVDNAPTIRRTLMSRGLLERADAQRFQIHMLLHAYAGQLYAEEFADLEEDDDGDDFDF